MYFSFSRMINKMNQKIYNNSIDSVKMAYDYTNRNELFNEIIKHDYNYLLRTNDKVDFKIMILDIFFKSQKIETFVFPQSINKIALNLNNKDLVDLENKSIQIKNYFKSQYLISFLTTMNFLAFSFIIYKVQFSGKLLKYQINNNFKNVKIKIFILLIFTGILQFCKSKEFLNQMFKFDFNENELRKYKEFRKIVENI